MGKLMLKDLETHDNVLVIPAFPSTYIDLFDGSEETFLTKHTYSTYLGAVTEMEEQYWQYYSPSSKTCDTRYCHLSDGSNRIIYDKIVRWIETGEFELDLSDFSKPYNDPFERYLV